MELKRHHILTHFISHKFSFLEGQNKMVNYVGVTVSSDQDFFMKLGNSPHLQEL